MKRTGNKKGFTLIELLIVLAICGMLAATVMGGAGHGCTASDGNRVGVVVQFSYGGFYLDTWEGQLILGGQGTVTTNTWNFSVLKSDIETIEKIKAAMSSKKQVELTYHKNRLWRPWNGSTTYFVKDVVYLE